MIDPTLRRLYLDTRYRIAFGRQELTLKIGEASPELDDILGQWSVERAAIVTAWNPRSQWLPRDENLKRGSALLTLVREMGLETLPVVASLDDPYWTEHGLFILGADEALACELGRQFAQNAVVLVRRGEALRLQEIVSPGGAS